jgi:hypothetical protein
MILDKGSQAEAGQPVRIDGEEEIFILDEVPVREDSSRAAEEIGLVHEVNLGRGCPSFDSILHEQRVVMGVDKDLVHPGGVEIVQPAV